jgi:hypothetical protein
MAVSIPLVCAGIACGPSLETMHESNLRFEHCYRLDMDPKIALSHRELCWRDWTEIYASGQPMDRIEYARRRIVALDSGDARLVTIVTTSKSQGRVFTEIGGPAADTPMAAPAPTSAHEPPPKTEPAPKVDTPKPEPPPPGLSRPGDACGNECTSTFSECNRLCEAKQADCVACREEYRKCMRRCFE